MERKLLRPKDVSRRFGVTVKTSWKLRKKEKASLPKKRGKEVTGAIKSYKIPIETPKDLIEEYFLIRKKALEFIFSHVKISKKAHLKLKNKDRRKLRDELLRDWKFSKHYVDSAINPVIGLIKGWITLTIERKQKINQR